MKFANSGARSKNCETAFEEMRDAPLVPDFTKLVQSKQ